MHRCPRRLPQRHLADGQCIWPYHAPFPGKKTPLTTECNLQMTRERPVERCPECGSVYKMEYVGPEDDHHHYHNPHGLEEPKTFANFVKPEYW